MKICVGCNEAESVEHVEGLGWVCESCVEVLPIVFEIEIERVREASRKVRQFVVDLRAGRI